MTRREFANEVLENAIDRLIRKLAVKAGGRYDHKHFTIYGNRPLDHQMGTCSGGPIELRGKVELLGRACDGFHHTLWGPVTADEYRKAVMNA